MLITWSCLYTVVRAPLAGGGHFRSIYQSSLDTDACLNTFSRFITPRGGRERGLKR